VQARDHLGSQNYEAARDITILPDKVFSLVPNTAMNKVLYVKFNFAYDHRIFFQCKNIRPDSLKDYDGCL